MFGFWLNTVRKRSIAEPFEGETAVEISYRRAGYA
jgi:hypothetical protein